MRPGDVVIGPNWVGARPVRGNDAARRAGRLRAGARFTGTDRFSLDVRYSMGRTVRADVEIKVR